MTFRSLILAPVLAPFLAPFAALTLCLGAHATTFGLENSVNATPTFSVTSSGVTATFTSPAGNGFVVQSTAGLFTFNTGLVDENFSPDALTILFSTPISGTIDIPFGVEDIFSTTDFLNVTANTGQTASFAATSDPLVLAEPEGLAAFLATAPVTSLTLTSTQPFAIGDITTVAPAPEPGSLMLLATGMAGLALRLRRRSGTGRS